MFDLATKSLVLGLCAWPFELALIAGSQVHHEPKPVGEVKMV